MSGRCRLGSLAVVDSTRNGRTGGGGTSAQGYASAPAGAGEAGALDRSVAPGLPDDAFAHDGLITKRHVRACALAALRPAPGELLWDVGAGSGAVGIEWVRSAPEARAIGFERDPVRAERARVNAIRFEVLDRLRIVDGDVAASLAALGEDAAPDAVFIGGGLTSGVLGRCWEALRPGGRLVVHTVTLEGERLAIDAFGAYGGELTRLLVEHAESLGRFTGWRPARAVVQWAARRPAG